MTASLASTAPAVFRAIPAYCTTPGLTHTPQLSHIAQCAKLGYGQSTTGTANLGHAVGYNFAPLLVIALIVLGVYALARKSRGRSTATAS